MRILASKPRGTDRDTGRWQQSVWRKRSTASRVNRDALDPHELALLDALTATLRALDCSTQLGEIHRELIGLRADVRRLARPVADAPAVNLLGAIFAFTGNGIAFSVAELLE